MPDNTKKKTFFGSPVQQAKPQNFFNQADLYRNPEIIRKMEELGQIFKNKNNSNPGMGELPYIPRPSMFQPDPLVIGRPEEAQLAKRMIDLDPITKEKVKQIMFGPDKSSMTRMSESKLPIDSYRDTSLLGVTDRESGNISINPGVFIGSSTDDATNTLAHEISHRSGYRDPDSYKIGDSMQGFLKRPRSEISKKDFDIVAESLAAIERDRIRRMKRYSK